MSLRYNWFKMSLIIIGTLIVVTMAGILILNAIVKTDSTNYITNIDNFKTLEKADCIIVLGAKVYSDDRLSPVLQDRVDYGITLYKEGKAAKLLFSGDHGQTEYDEVNAMMNYAIERGIPKEDIFLDHAGFSTYESMVRARDIFCAEKVIIVTQQFHLYRAVYVAHKLGLDAVGVNSDPQKYANETYNEVREIFAQVKDFLYVNLFLPKPTYLGETIPIFGDSSLTHDKQ